MDRAARPATAEDLKRLAKALNDEGVEYLLIGGYALFASNQSGREKDRLDRLAIERAIDHVKKAR